MVPDGMMDVSENWSVSGLHSDIHVGCGHSGYWILSMCVIAVKNGEILRLFAVIFLILFSIGHLLN